jgi:hypothetical protein
MRGLDVAACGLEGLEVGLEGFKPHVIEILHLRPERSLLLPLGQLHLEERLPEEGESRAWGRG